MLVIAAMGLRMFRLAEPARMHFDEVYHARTAAEFLQDWRYGISHYIYEWTHPHLAKYAMAGGIVLFAGHDTQATSDLGVPVRDAAIEPRRPDPSSTTARDGDRVWVATGSALTGYDLHTRKPVASWTVDGAAALAFDSDRNKLYVGTDGGELLALDLASLDGLDAGAIDQVLQPELVATLDGPISRLAPFDDGSHLAAILPGDTVVILDPDTGTETGRAVVPGAVDMAAAGSAQAIVGAPGQVDDPAAVAAELASILGGDAASFEDRLADTEQETVVVAPVPTGDVRAKLQTAIDDGKLPGISVDAVAQLAVAGTDGVTLLTGSGSTAATVDLQGPATGLALGDQHRRRHAALRHHHRRVDRRAAAGRRRGDGGVGREGTRDPRHAADAGSRHARGVRLGGRDGRGPRDEAGRDGIDGLRRRAPWQERVRRPGRPVPADAPGSSTTARTTRRRTGARSSRSAPTARRRRSMSATTRSPGGCPGCSWAR